MWHASSFFQLYFKSTGIYNMQWQNAWIIPAFWQVLSFSLLCVICALWAPSHNSMRSNRGGWRSKEAEDIKALEIPACTLNPVSYIGLFEKPSSSKYKPDAGVEDEGTSPVFSKKGLLAGLTGLFSKQIKRIERLRPPAWGDTITFTIDEPGKTEINQARKNKIESLRDRDGYLKSRDREVEDGRRRKDREVGDGRRCTAMESLREIG
ncbi:Transmembrane receptor, eukaryota [Cynara cardunculus var. scolymus]|uniref:Transmembrane receptor, eukaryota n=1 Tax=Cynara cardunculus var. scolymus TaxID=59895 RepID=A0A124SEQ8_CYNCS|nr:Transmembrane receptor, eukaryota [Cynara cardunculus var. scolymus]